MKKCLCLCLCFVIVFSFAGCGEFTPPQVQTRFSCVADVLYNDTEIVCKISAGGRGNTRIDVTYPDSVRGAFYVWNDSSFRVGFGDLYVENSSVTLPDSSFAVILGEFLNGLYTEENTVFIKTEGDVCEFSLNSQSGATFTTDKKNGIILSAKLPDMEVEFRDQQLL